MSHFIQTRKYIWCMLASILFLAGCSSHRHAQETDQKTTAQIENFRIVGYVPDYSIDRVAPSAYDRITDAILFSAVLTEQGVLSEECLASLPVARFQDIKKRHGIRIHLCVGGWGRSEGFAAMTGDDERRNAFVAMLTQWCLDNCFDGVDYDWEFPASPAEQINYGTLLEATAQAFQPHGLRVTVALGHTQTLHPNAYRAVDAIHLMTYDMGTRHALPRDADASVRRLMRSGAPRDKIILGIPFYGRKIDNRDVAMAYANILDQFSPQPHQDEIGGFYFNNANTIREKTLFSLDQCLGGVMIWELSMDSDDHRSLLHVIKETCSNAGVAPNPM